MGIGNLVEVLAGKTGFVSQINQYRNALMENLVPRNSSGIATASAGDVGTSTYPWKDGHFTGELYRSGGVNQFLPTGMIVPFAGPTAPTRWLLCNGATIGDSSSGATYSGDEYEALFEMIKLYYGNAGTEVWSNHDTVYLPDTRGRFLRSWDNGAGIDSGRALGSIQAETTKSHNHMMFNWYAVDQDLYTWDSNNNLIVVPQKTLTTTYVTVSTNTTGQPGLDDCYTATQNYISGETRPVNLSVNYIIKY